MEGPYDGLLRTSWDATALVLRAASGAYVVLFAMVGLLLVRPWKDGGGSAVATWLLSTAAPVLMFAVVAFMYQLSREAVGRWKLGPAWGYGDGRWYFWIDRRGTDSSRGFRCTVRDDLGGATTHEFGQLGTRFADLFPDTFDVTGMKAGRKQPWGRYSVTWEMFEGRKRKARCRFTFDWRPFQVG